MSTNMEVKLARDRFIKFYSIGNLIQGKGPDQFMLYINGELNSPAFATAKIMNKDINYKGLDGENFHNSDQYRLFFTVEDGSMDIQISEKKETPLNERKTERLRALLSAIYSNPNFNIYSKVSFSFPVSDDFVWNFTNMILERRTEDNWGDFNFYAFEVAANMRDHRIMLNMIQKYFLRFKTKFFISDEEKSQRIPLAQVLYDQQFRGIDIKLENNRVILSGIKIANMAMNAMQVRNDFIETYNAGRIIQGEGLDQFEVTMNGTPGIPSPAIVNFRREYLSHDFKGPQDSDNEEATKAPPTSKAMGVDQNNSSRGYIFLANRNEAMSVKGRVASWFAAGLLILFMDKSISWQDEVIQKDSLQRIALDNGVNIFEFENVKHEDPQAIADRTGVTNLPLFMTINGMESGKPFSGVVLLPDVEIREYDIPLNGENLYDLKLFLFGDYNDPREIRIKNSRVPYLKNTFPLDGIGKESAKIYVLMREAEHLEVSGKLARIRLENKKKISERAIVHGGIDLNAANMAMSQKGEEINITFDQAMIDRFKKGDFKGIVPTVLNITPIPNILPILGLVPSKEETEQIAVI